MAAEGKVPTLAEVRETTPPSVCTRPSYQLRVSLCDYAAGPGDRCRAPARSGYFYHPVAGFRPRDGTRIALVGLGVKGQWLLCSRLELIGLLLMFVAVELTTSPYNFLFRFCCCRNNHISKASGFCAFRFCCLLRSLGANEGTAP